MSRCVVNLVILKNFFQTRNWKRFGMLPMFQGRINSSIHILHVKLTALTLPRESCWHQTLVYAQIDLHLRWVIYPNLVQKRAGLFLSLPLFSPAPEKYVRTFQREYKC